MQRKQASEQNLWDKRAEIGVWKKKRKDKIILKVRTEECPNIPLSDPPSAERNISQKQLIPSNPRKETEQSVVQVPIYALLQQTGPEPLHMVAFLREVEDLASKKDRFWYVVKREMILQRKDH